MSTQEQKPQPEKEEKKPAPQQNPPAQEKPAEAATKPAEQAKPAAEAAPKAEKQTNCPVCNKPIKRLTRYYRDGKFYCAKKCWRTAKEKAKNDNEPEKK